MPVWDHSGQYQSEWLKTKLIPHLAEQDFKDIIVIAGNHDFLFQQTKKRIDWPDNVHYLQDQALTIGEVNFYGTPWSVQFGTWAFMAEDYQLAHIWDLIPKQTDVLIVHGPPYGAGDQTSPIWTGESEHVGSHSLRAWIEENAPHVVVTGHIHESWGEFPVGLTTVYNVSYLNEDYKPANDPVRITL